VIIAAGVNDISFGAAAVQAAATTFFQTLRARLPNVLIIALGPFYSTGFSLSTMQQIESAIQTALSVGDAANYGRLSFFIPNISEQWFTGTGSAGSPNGSGNCDFYMSVSPHPTQSGQEFLGSQLATRIKTFVLPNLPG
jgi:hypothetical protein